MTDSRYFEGVKNQKCFNRQQVLQSFRNAGYKLSDASFYKRFASMVKDGDLARVGNGLYCLPSNNARPYDHEYSDLAVEVASLVQEQYPLVDFSIMELIQLNDFVNHQLAHNILFLSVESDVIEFVFDMLKDQYFGKVFINPTLEMYHQYWSDNMIVINKLTTEAPKSAGISWHTRLEKLLVDIVADPLLLDSVSESEYPTIYEDAFSMYVVDESCLFRYAARRAVDKKIKKLIREKTNITLRTKR